MWSEEQPDNSAEVMTATATAACAGNHRFIARPGDIPAQQSRVALCGGTTWDNGLACKRMPCLPPAQGGHGQYDLQIFSPLRRRVNVSIQTA